MEPKVFISYSWSSPMHREFVRGLADRLFSDGVNVVLDQYDLKEGDDKHAFMEKMVVDETITHVLLISDQKYAEKADKRKDGVGTEAQIVSKEIYESVVQEKFIPIVTEINEKGEPFLPTYLGSRIYIDFSSPDKVNKNWEQLIRSLYGKPFHQKPELGQPPVYISDEAPIPANDVHGKYEAWKQAVLQEKPGIHHYRRSFLDACIAYADKLRVRERPEAGSIGEKVLEDAKKLTVIRNYIVDWLLFESEFSPSDETFKALIELLEELRELKARPPELNTWSDAWFEAHGIFVYETFLYIIAALIKLQSYEVLHEVFTTHYLRPSVERHGEKKFDRFDAFYFFSETLQRVLAPEGKKLYSPTGEFIKLHADRSDIPMSKLIEADLLILMMSFLSQSRWFPLTLYYSSYSEDYLLFLRSTQHKYFKNLAVITGIDSSEELKRKVIEGFEASGIQRRGHFLFDRDILHLMNLEKLDTLE